MSIGEIIRYIGFTGLDIMRARKVSHHLDDLKAYFVDPLNHEVIQEKRKDQFLKFACETVPYYKAYKEFSSVDDFPIIDKKVINETYDDFISGAYNHSSLSVAITSGSYGTPTTYYHTQDKKARRSAEIIFFNRWAGYEIGMKHILVRARPKSALKLLAENEILIRPIGMDSGWFKSQWQLLTKQRIKFIIGYPSVLAALAIYYKNNYSSAEPFICEGIISYAEPLFEDARAVIEEVFNCPVISRYSSEELGVIAHQCVSGGKYHLNFASYFIELLALNEDRPVERSEPGRVIVTDLFSHAMPLIRYDTGDLAVLDEGCSCGLETPVFKRIDGRQAELIYDTNGRALSPLVIVTPIARTLKGIIQFQFIQKDLKYYIIRLAVYKSFPKDRVDLIKAKLLKVLGEDAEIGFEYVSAISPLPSGKRPYIINEYHNHT